MEGVGERRQSGWLARPEVAYWCWKMPIGQQYQWNLIDKMLSLAATVVAKKLVKSPG